MTVDGAIDILCNHFTTENIERNILHNPSERDTFERLGLMDNLRGHTPKDFLSYLDGVGVDKVLVTAIQCGPWFEPEHRFQTEAEEVFTDAAVDPTRILGLYGINPNRRMEGVRELERAVTEFGFKGAHIHPHGYGMPPDHAFYFPFYAKCAELGVPVVLSMGNTQDAMPVEPGRPIHLDPIALYFPDLTIVCTHTGWPWMTEAIALASKHKNLYLGTSAYAPKYWTPEFVRFIDAHGRNKVMWGTDFPMISHERSLREIEGLGLRDEAKQRLLRDNALRVFGLE
jgi:predicted TIM-barrel fold metal-dependent hydrolase